MEIWTNDSKKIIMHVATRSGSSSASEWCIQNSFDRKAHINKPELVKSEYHTFLFFRNAAERLASGAYKMFEDSAEGIDGVTIEDLEDLPEATSVSTVYNWLITNYEDIKSEPLIDLELDFLQRLDTAKDSNTYRVTPDTISSFDTWSATKSLPSFPELNQSSEVIRTRTSVLATMISDNIDSLAFGEDLTATQTILDGLNSIENI